MNIWDFLIIYLACGSPFAVHILVTSNGSISKLSTTFVVVRWTMWPVFAIALLVRLLGEFADPSSRGPGRTEQIALDRARSAMENSELISNGTVPLFEFRDSLLRYSGLSLESGISPRIESVPEIFDVSMHPAPLIASACLHRKNRERLRHHQDNARKDFLDMVERIAGDEGEREPILRSALDTASVAKDAEGVRAISLALGISEKFQDLVLETNKGGEIWNTAPHSEPNIS